MPTFEERLAYLEGRVEEHSRGVDGVREALVSLERRMDARFEGVDRRFEGIEQRLTGLDEKMTRYFVWLVGVLVTTEAAVVAALVGR